MSKSTSLFEMFGGIRPMARKLSVLPSSVSAWKRKGCIPAGKQPHVLKVGLALGLPITAENVVFPLGRPSDVANTITASPAPVACDPQAETQGTGAGQ